MGMLIVKKIGNKLNCEIKAIDEFILHDNTNGEFINTLKYLKYHPRERISFGGDQESGEIRGCLLAVEYPW